CATRCDIVPAHGGETNHSRSGRRELEASRHQLRLSRGGQAPEGRLVRTKRDPRECYPATARGETPIVEFHRSRRPPRLGRRLRRAPPRAGERRPLGADPPAAREWPCPPGNAPARPYRGPPAALPSRWGLVVSTCARHGRGR